MEIIIERSKHGGKDIDLQLLKVLGSKETPHPIFTDIITIKSLIDKIEEQAKLIEEQDNYIKGSTNSLTTMNNIRIANSLKELNISNYNKETLLNKYILCNFNNEKYICQVKQGNCETDLFLVVIRNKGTDANYEHGQEIGISVGMLITELSSLGEPKLYTMVEEDKVYSIDLNQ